MRPEAVYDMLGQGREEILRAEKEEAWLDYLREVRAAREEGRYAEVEPWAWMKLKERLAAAEAQR